MHFYGTIFVAGLMVAASASASTGNSEPCAEPCLHHGSASVLRTRRNAATEAPVDVEQPSTAPPPNAATFNLSQALYDLTNRTDYVREQLVRMQDIYKEHGFRGVVNFLNNAESVARSAEGGNEELPLFSEAPAVLANTDTYAVLSAPREVFSYDGSVVVIELTQLVPFLTDPRVLAGQPIGMKQIVLNIRLSP